MLSPLILVLTVFTFYPKISEQSRVLGMCPKDMRNTNYNILKFGEYIPIYKMSMNRLDKESTMAPFFYDPPSIGWQNFSSYFQFGITRKGEINKVFRRHNKCAMMDHLEIRGLNSASYKLYNSSYSHGRFCKPVDPHRIRFSARWSQTGEIAVIYGCFNYPSQEYNNAQRFREIGVYVIVHSKEYEEGNENSFEKWEKTAMKLLEFDEMFDRSWLKTVPYISEEEIESASTDETFRQFQEQYCATLLCMEDKENVLPIVLAVLVLLTIIILTVLCFAAIQKMKLCV